MTVIVGMSASHKPRWYTHPLGIKAIRKVMFNAQISLKLALMGCKQISIVQNVPPLTPFKAVKSVNLPAAGVVKPMVELLIVLLAIVTLLIVPPVITVFFTFSVMMLGFINHCIQGMLGRPVVGSRNDEYGMLMLLLGTAVAISYPQQTF